MSFVPETRNLFATITTVDREQKTQTMGRLVLGWSSAVTSERWTEPMFESGRADGMPMTADHIFPDCEVIVGGYVVVEAEQ